MELKEFIKQSLIEITTAVIEARAEVIKHGVTIAEYTVGNEAVINSENKYCITKDCDFDVAVTVRDSGTKDAKGGISVMGIGIGASVGEVKDNTSISRIAFSIPITFEAATRERVRRG